MGQQRMKELDAGKGGLTEGKRGAEKKKATKKTREEREKERMEARAAKAGKEVRYIVRIASKDLDGTLPVARALTGIKGVNGRFASAAATAFERHAGIGHDKLLGEIPDEKCKILEDVVMNPVKYGIPTWLCNRARERSTGENRHLVMSDLDFAARQDFQRLGNIKSYRGLRHVWGLPVRGQRTKGTHRGKGAVVGVLKKDARKAAASGGKKK